MQSHVQVLNMQVLNYDPASLNGLSEKLIVSHHQNNYGGAVKRLNAIRSQLAAADFTGMAGFSLNGSKREELSAVNSMQLHELYFASLGGNGELPPPMALALAASFGDVSRWRDEFVAMGKALGGGSGWVILTYVPRDGTLINQAAADHTQCVALGIPLLALDMYEHAYHIDFGADVAAYIAAFMSNIDWSAVALRYAQAVHAASEGLGAPLDAVASAVLIDVRRAGIFAQVDSMIPNAEWRDPADIARWMENLPRNRDIVVYCVYGHEVGRSCAVRLRAAGFNARFLDGGIEAWQMAGRALVSKTPAS